MIYRDQHGRPWEVTFDLQAMATTGCKTPYRWTAPVLPPDAYFIEFKDRPLLFEIDYAKWVSDLEVRAKEHYQQCIEVARKLDKEPTSVMVREIVGKAPYPADLAKACRAGNKWALGLTPDWRTRFPPWAESYKQDYWAPELPTEKTFADVDGDFADVADVADVEPAGAMAAVGALPDEKYGAYEDVHDPTGVGGQRQKTHKMKAST